MNAVLLKQSGQIFLTLVKRRESLASPGIEPTPQRLIVAGLLAQLRRVLRFERPAGPQDRDQDDGAAQVSAGDDPPKRRAGAQRPLRMAGS